MKYLWNACAALLACLALLFSCERPLMPVEEGELSFSADTVLFDSIFTTFQGPSELLLAFNSSNNDVRVSRVWLESGENSEFDLIVDGIRENDVQDLIIARDDSMHVFITMKSQERDMYAEEYIAFQVGDQVQRVLIRAFVRDAYFLRARLTSDSTFQGFIFTRDTVLTPEKAIIMDGPIFIQEGVTVRVQAGTRIFFTPYKYPFSLQDGSRFFAFFSTLIVGGTLIVEGEPDFPVIFEGSRLDSIYRENPAQWRGIRFTQTSQRNRITHATIKNALIGLQIDSISTTPEPKVWVQRSRIRNMGAYGIFAIGAAPNAIGQAPALLMENSVVNTCKEHTLFVLAGGYQEFVNCTFANYNLLGFSRRTPQLRVSNYLETPTQFFVYPSVSRFVNCAVYGTEENEVIVDSLAGGSFTELNFDHCLIRYAEDNEVPIAPYVTNSILNEDPLFNAPRSRDYRPQEGSPLIDAGFDLSAAFRDDIRGKQDSLRTLPFDIGAYEFFPIE